MRLALTKRTGDSIRMLMFLAAIPDGERRTSTQLSEACGVSMGNVPTLVAALSRADLLDCARGPGGGCRLSRSPDAITIAQAIVAIEGSLDPEHCAVDERRCAEQDFACGIHETWSTVIRQLRESLTKLTLTDALTRHETNRSNAAAAAPLVDRPDDILLGKMPASSES